MGEMTPIADHGLEAADLARLYRALALIRRAEEEIARVYPTDVIKSPVHLSIGQEGLAVAICDVLRPRDVVAVTYRCHAAYLAKGGDLRAMIAELYGKITGCARGKGGSMHLVAPEVGVLGATAVVGTNIPVAVGQALAFKRRGEDRLVACFFGDGATEEGVFSESLNFASLHKLPVLFVCENNFYAIHQPLSKRWATDRLCERVETYGIPAARVSDGDLFTLRAAAEHAVNAIREGEGPQFIEAFAYRWKEHVGPGDDFAAGYRSEDEATPWKLHDPVTWVGSLLAADEREAIDADVAARIADAFAFAENSPFPPEEELLAHVHAP